MARTNKTGIDYFPFDVDFFQDEKIQFVSARFGLKGEVITIRLMCKIYRNGYYTEWNDDTALLFAKSVGDGCQDSFVKDVVHELLKRGFFDRNIFERFGILTSRGIQSRYFEATRRYKQIEVINDYLLINVSEMINVNIIKINADINSINANINQQKKRKVNRKENEKEIESNNAHTRVPTLEERKKKFMNECAFFVEQYGKEMVRAFFDYWTEPNKTHSKMRFEMEKTWDLGRRFTTWNNNESKFNSNGTTQRNNKASCTRPSTDELNAAVEIGFALAEADE